MINIKWFHILLICWAIILFNSEVPGKIEGYYKPVISNFEITQSTSGLYSTIFSGTFDKNRACIFLDIEWYISDQQDGDSKIRVSFEEGEVIRIPGKQVYGPWKVNIPLSRIETESYASVVHRCHSLWTTITKVYP